MVYSKCFKLFFFFLVEIIGFETTSRAQGEDQKGGGGVILVSTQGLGTFLLIWGKKEDCKKRTLSQPCVGGIAFQI